MTPRTNRLVGVTPDCTMSCIGRSTISRSRAGATPTVSSSRRPIPRTSSRVSPHNRHTPPRSPRRRSTTARAEREKMRITPRPMAMPLLNARTPTFRSRDQTARPTFTTPSRTDCTPELSTEAAGATTARTRERTAFTGPARMRMIGAASRRTRASASPARSRSCWIARRPTRTSKSRTRFRKSSSRFTRPAANSRKRSSPRPITRRSPSRSRCRKRQMR